MATPALWTRRSALLGGLLAPLAAFGAAFAQDDKRLAAARAKGAVSLYSSLAPEEMLAEVAAGFRRRTGITANVLYGGSGRLFSRVTTERKAGSYKVDVLSISDMDMVRDLVAAKALRPYRDALPAGVAASPTSDPGGYWYDVVLWGQGLVYNSQLIKEAQAPKGWEELADPRWRSKLVLADPLQGANGFLTLRVAVQYFGWEWVERLMRNDPLVIGVAPSLMQAVTSGERPVGTSTTSYTSGALQDGAPVAQADAELLFVVPVTLSAVADAPNPEGAELLIDYMLSKEAAAAYVKYGWFSTRPDAGGPFGFPSADKLRVKHRGEIPSTMSRQDYLDRYSAILSAARR